MRAVRTSGDREAERDRLQRVDEHRCEGSERTGRVPFEVQRLAGHAAAHAEAGVVGVQVYDDINERTLARMLRLPAHVCQRRWRLGDGGLGQDETQPHGE